MSTSDASKALLVPSISRSCSICAWLIYMICVSQNEMVCVILLGHVTATWTCDSANTWLIYMTQMWWLDMTRMWLIGDSCHLTLPDYLWLQYATHYESTS
jgi:hypothetical protein